MLETYFQGIVLTSLIGTVFVLLLMAIKPLTQKCFSATWHYYIWLVVLVAMIMPIRLNLPKLDEIPAVSQTAMHMEKAVEGVLKDIGLMESGVKRKEIITDENGHRLVSPHLQEKRDREATIERKMEMIATLWGTVALLILTYKVGSYVLFIKKIKRTTREVDCPQLARYTRRKVAVRTGEWLGSPLLFGVFKPILLLPDRHMNEVQLHNVLSHEMTHLRRNDMLYKWFVVLVKCVHWFNPVVYFVSAQVNQECEISCDLAVTEQMNKEERMSYVETILALFADQRQKDYALTMGMAGSKELLKKRFLKMKNRIVVSKSMKRCSQAVATALLVVIMLVSGGMAVKAFPDLEAQNLLPAVSECSDCGHDQLFYGRQLARQVLDDEVLVYYAYLYACEECGHSWSRRQEVTSRYVIKMSYRSSYTIAELSSLNIYSDPEGQKVFEEARELVSAKHSNSRELLKMVDKLVEKSRKQQ